MLSTGNQNRLGRGFVVLSPPLKGLVPFPQMVGDPRQHDTLLHQAQRLRGKMYLKDGAIQVNQLTPDGRHVQAADAVSWHLLTLNQAGRVSACIRYRAHAPTVSYEDLGIAAVLAYQSGGFAKLAERMVRNEIAKAKWLGFSYVELGGWVVDDDLRCSTEAMRMLLMMYSLSQLLGGAIALTTATTRHHSSSILRRSGGKSLTDGAVEVPTYFDSRYNCEMELLSFDSRSPNPRYAGWIQEFREEAFQNIPMVCAAPIGVSQSLLNLHTAASAGVIHREPQQITALVA
jgi:hypothetical protein